MRETGFVKYNHCLIPLRPGDQPLLVSYWTRVSLLLAYRAILMRWNSEFDRQEESAFWHVIKDSFEPYEALGKKRRGEIRRALANYDIRAIAQSDVAAHGYPIYCLAHTRYGSPSNVSESAYRADILEKDEKCHHYWGIFVKGTNNMVGYCINRVFSDSVTYISEKIIPEHLRRYASYAINYVMNEYYLCKLGFRFIDLGAKSLRHDTKVQEFHMSKMGCRKAYCRLHVQFFPGVGILLWLLQPIRGFFCGTNGWKGLIDLLYIHWEYAMYGHDPEIIYVYDSATESTWNDGSQCWTDRILTFRPTLRCLARHSITFRERLVHLFWYLACRNKYTIYYVIDGDTIAHTSYVLGWNFRFTYMKREDLSVGPVWTHPEYRGKGILPTVLSHIVRTLGKSARLFATVNNRNRSSRRGFEKAGFRFWSYGYTTVGLRLFRSLR